MEAPPHLGPPGGQHEVCVDVVLSKLLGHVESQRAIRIVDVPLGEVTQDGVGTVQLLELLRRLRVVRVLIGVVPQRQLPDITRRC